MRLYLGFYIALAAVGLTLLAALAFPRGFALAVIGDTMQFGLEAAAALLALQNALRSRSQIRAFWLLVFLGTLMWSCSQLIWSAYELWFRIPLPDTPIADILVFVKLVPLAAAAALEADKSCDLRVRTFGLLDLSILIFVSLYLFAFYVSAYRFVPGGMGIYSYHFDVAHAVGNQLFIIVTGVAFLRASRSWRGVLGILFFASIAYAGGSDLADSAIDLGHYYTGSLFDLPLIASMASFVWLCLAGRPLLQSDPSDAGLAEVATKPRPRFTFASSHLAMLVTISIPALGLWLVAFHSPSGPLFSFRLHLTLGAIFLLTLLLSVKQDLLSANLLGSLQHLSHTYSSIDRFKGHLLQSEKLTALGELVANAARHIAEAMTLVQQQAFRITSRSPAESRPSILASKIGQYALRTDALAESMQRFAQETPLQIAAVEVKPLLENALHLSRIGKVQNLRVDLREEGPTPPVFADSSQLLHVFLEILSNAMDALEEVGGGDLVISIRPCEPQVCIQFADNGPGIKYPQHVFEPFFTTKPVGKGTGLGLSTCYGIIRQHNGDISCGNRLEGGAHFTIFLPAAPLPSSNVAPPAGSLVAEETR
jgi:signal transduction histidine kinase